MRKTIKIVEALPKDAGPNERGDASPISQADQADAGDHAKDGHAQEKRHHHQHDRL
jgi:hypothetical protein